MIHYDDHNAGKVEKAINRAIGAFAIIVFPLSLLATVAFVSQTGVFQPGPRLVPETPNFTTTNWTPPILDTALIHDDGTNPTPTPAARQPAIPAPTSTPAPSPTATPSVTPTPTPPSGILTIYADAFTSGWNTSQSWDATVNPSNGTSVYAGSNSISYVANNAWAGLQIWNDSGVDTSRFTYLRFAIRATRTREPFAVYLRNSDYVDLTDPIPLSRYGGYPRASGWTVYTIPLADLNADDVSLSGIIIHDWSGTGQPAIYVDSIELLP